MNEVLYKKDWQDLRQMFRLCLSVEQYYYHVDNAGDYYTMRNGDTLYLLLQWTDGVEDWKNNFDFAARPYKDMGTKWKAHRGFVRVWKSIEPHVSESIMDPEVKMIVVVGYSHGAALAILAHEYIWFNRPDIRDRCITFAFEAPRVFKGRLPKELKERWTNCYTTRVGNDIVTHVPPRVFGFRHVGNVIHIIPDKTKKVKAKKKDEPMMDAEAWVKHCALDSVNAHWQDNVDFALGCVKEYFPDDPAGCERWIINEYDMKTGEIRFKTKGRKASWIHKR